MNTVGSYSSRCSFKLSLERNREKCIGCREDVVHEVCRISKMGNPTYFVLHARVLINVSTCHLLNSFNAWSACSSIHPLQMLLPSSDDQFTKCSVRLFINTSTPSARSGCSSLILPPSDDQFTISPFQFTRSSHPALLPLTWSFPLLSGVHSHGHFLCCLVSTPFVHKRMLIMSLFHAALPPPPSDIMLNQRGGCF